jgi:hypothetical protein
MINERNDETNTVELADEPLVVEVPTEIQAGLARAVDYNCTERLNFASVAESVIR